MRLRVARAGLLIVPLVAACCGPADAGGAVRWGYDLALLVDLSHTTNDLEPKTRAFPLGGSVVGTLRLPLGRRLTLVGGAGYEHRVRTEQASGMVEFTGLTIPFELTFQRRVRSSIVPMALEAEFRPGWSVAAGGEWRHVFQVSTRAKSASFAGEAFVPDISRAGWRDATELYRSDELSLTFAVSRRWGGPGATHALSLRWVEGLQDPSPSPDLDIHEHTLELVWGWSR
jgi:hypothetical protein